MLYSGDTAIYSDCFQLDLQDRGLSSDVPFIRTQMSCIMQRSVNLHGQDNVIQAQIQSIEIIFSCAAWHCIILHKCPRLL